MTTETKTRAEKIEEAARALLARLDTMTGDPFDPEETALRSAMAIRPPALRASPEEGRLRALAQRALDFARGAEVRSWPPGHEMRRSLIAECRVILALPLRSPPPEETATAPVAGPPSCACGHTYWLHDRIHLGGCLGLPEHACGPDCHDQCWAKGCGCRVYDPAPASPKEGGQ